MNNNIILGKFSAKQIGDKADEILKWSNEHPAAGKEDYDAKVKELEAI